MAVIQHMTSMKTGERKQHSHTWGAFEKVEGDTDHGEQQHGKCSSAKCRDCADLGAQPTSGRMASVHRNMPRHIVQSQWV